MKTKKVYAAVLGAWAAMMRRFFPRYCVRNLTLKGNKNAYLFLPGVEKEDAFLAAPDEFIAARVWSYETKLHLLARKRFVLVNEIYSEKEFDEVLQAKNVQQVIAALRVYTPSRTKMLKTLCGRSFDNQVWCDIAKAVPAAFESLKPWEILGVPEGCLCYPNEESWNLAVALAEVRASWAPLFMQELRRIPPQYLGDKGRELMTHFFYIAFRVKLDVSFMMPYLYVIFSELYLEVRKNYAGYRDFAPYVEMMFPQVFKFLKPDEAKTSFSQIKFPAKVEDGEEAYAWLLIIYNLLDNNAVYVLMRRYLRAIKQRVNINLFNELFDKMIAEARSATELQNLYAMCEALNAEPRQWYAIQERVVAMAEENDNHVCLGFAFPFKGWDRALARRAVVVMAKKKHLDVFVTRLGELPYELDKVAFEAMEIQSQLDAFDVASYLIEMVTTMKLYPAAEKKFLCATFRLPMSREELQRLQLEYINRVKIADTVFTALISGAPSDNIYMFVDAYAKKWGLEVWQYQYIMQSRVSPKAPLWRKYVLQEAEVK